MPEKSKMKMFSRLLIVFIFSFIATSCNRGPKNAEEYYAWFNDEKNGFVKTREINDLVFRVQYRPLSLQMLNDLDLSRKYSDSEVDSLKKSYGDSKYFMLEIGLKDPKEVGEDVVNKSELRYRDYLSMMEKTSFHMNENVELIAGKDTLKPSIYHYERGYELGKRERFIFAFPVSNTNATSEMTFVYNDQLFNAAKLNFKFDINEDNIPGLPLR